MTWFFLSFACAFFSATSAAFVKMLLVKRTELAVIWGILLVSLPFLFVNFVFSPSAFPGIEFWKTVAVMLPIEIGAFFLYMRALKLSPISLVFPFLGLTPVFTILTSAVILNEKLRLAGITGVALVSIGAYLLNIHSIKDGVLAPIIHMYKEKGVFFMIIVAFLYSLTSVLGKKAMLLSSPSAFPLIYYGILGLVLTPVVYLQKIKRKKQDTPVLPHALKPAGKVSYLFLMAGISLALAAIFQFAALPLTKVSYFISVKRMSLVITVIYGFFLFKEKDILYRLTGASVMLLGVLILSFA